VAKNLASVGREESRSISAPTRDMTLQSRGCLPMLETRNVSLKCFPKDRSDAVSSGADRSRDRTLVNISNSRDEKAADVKVKKTSMGGDSVGGRTRIPR